MRLCREVRLLVTRPLTNVATAYMLDEELVDRVRRGNVYDTEFNF